MAVMKYLRMVALSEDEGKGEKERTNVGIVSFELRDAGDEQWSAVCERCRDTKMADVKVELLGSCSFFHILRGARRYFDS